MCSIEVIRRENKKNKKLKVELDKKQDTQELEKMITNFKVQIEEDKIIEETLKEQLEEKDRIIGNLEVDILTLRKDLQNKNMHNNSKVLDDIINSQYLIMTSPDLDTIRQKWDQAPKQQSKKHIQNVMQKQSKGIGRYTRKITGTLLHREDSDFRITN
jgi:hypothetical protein